MWVKTSTTDYTDQVWNDKHFLVTAVNSSCGQAITSLLIHSSIPVAG